MNFLIDTCTMNHIHNLFFNQIIDLRPNLKQFKIAVTPAILDEWKHYQLDLFYPGQNCYIIPINQSEIDSMLVQFPFFSDFDFADQTLIYASIHENSVIISDDRALNAAIISLNKKAITLPDFCLKLISENNMIKTEFIRMMRFWEKNHSYSKKELKRWHAYLIQIT